MVKYRIVYRYSLMIDSVLNIKNRTHRLAIVAIVFLAGLVMLSLFAGRSAHATGFNPGNIMSDYVMSNKNTMSESQIQSFLKSKVNCSSKGDYSNGSYYYDKLRKSISGKTAYSKTSKGTFVWNIKNGHFVCMADDKFGGETAARIIYRAAQDYNINPQVLIVTLQKEQGLITDGYPNNQQYNTAMGFGCPDTAACNTKYYGLKNQVRSAAALYREVLSGGWTNYPVGVNYIQYNPSTSCGGTKVNIRNRATSALYRYTPYQPNKGALNAGWGTAPCGAYGNRNFYLYFTNWFGSTQTNGFTSLDDPRWMQLKADTYKHHVLDGNNFGPELQSGRQIYFPDKILISGTWYLRTQWDKSYGNTDGIPLSDLIEINIVSIPPVWKSIPNNTKKVDPIRTKSHETVAGLTAVEVADMVTVNGNTYYRTTWESNRNRPRFLPASDLANFTFYGCLEPRTLYAPRNVTRVNVQTGASTGSMSAGDSVFFNKRITVDGTLYVQATGDNGSLNAYRYSDLSNTPGINFVSLDNPRTMKLRSDTYKRHLPSEVSFGPKLLRNRQVYFSDKIFINNQWYLRTQWDKDHGNQDGIPLVDLTEL